MKKLLKEWNDFVNEVDKERLKKSLELNPEDELAQAQLGVEKSRGEGDSISRFFLRDGFKVINYSPPKDGWNGNFMTIEKNINGRTIRVKFQADIWGGFKGKLIASPYELIDGKFIRNKDIPIRTSQNFGYHKTFMEVLNYVKKDLEDLVVHLSNQPLSEGDGWKDLDQKMTNRPDDWYGAIQQKEKQEMSVGGYNDQSIAVEELIYKAADELKEKEQGFIVKYRWEGSPAYADEFLDLRFAMDMEDLGIFGWVSGPKEIKFVKGIEDEFEHLKNEDNKFFRP